MLNALLLSCTAVLSIAADVATADAQALSIPQRIASTAAPTRNVWVSASLALDEKRHLDDASLPPDQIAVLRDALAERKEVATSDGCGGVYLGFPAVEQYAPLDTIENLLAQSSEIVSGHVVASEVGFFEGVPARLLRVVVDQPIRT